MERDTASALASANELAGAPVVYRSVDRAPALCCAARGGPLWRMTVASVLRSRAWLIREICEGSVLYGPLR